MKTFLFDFSRLPFLSFFSFSLSKSKKLRKNTEKQIKQRQMFVCGNNKKVQKANEEEKKTRD